MCWTLVGRFIQSVIGFCSEMNAIFLIWGIVTKDNQTITRAHISWSKTIIAQVKSFNSQTFCLIFAVNVRLPIHSLRSSIPCVNIILDNAMNCSQSIFNLIIQFTLIWLTLYEFWILCPLNFLQERAKYEFDIKRYP